METLICICMNIVYIILGSSAPRISIEAFRPVRARQTCKVSITVCTLDVHGPRLRRLQLKPDRHRHRHRRSTTIGVHWPRFSGFDSFNQVEFYFSLFFFIFLSHFVHAIEQSNGSAIADRVRVWMQSSFARPKTNLGLSVVVVGNVLTEFGPRKYVKQISAIIWVFT